MRQLIPTNASLAMLIAALLLAGTATAAMTSMRTPLFGAADEAKEAADARDARLLCTGRLHQSDRLLRARRRNVQTGRQRGQHPPRSDESGKRLSEIRGIGSTSLPRRSRPPSGRERTHWQRMPRSTRPTSGTTARGTSPRQPAVWKKAASNPPGVPPGRLKLPTGGGELIAIKANYLNETRDLIAMAEKLKAERYAPESLTNARTLLTSAETALNENRYDTDKPRSLAADAKHNAAARHLRGQARKPDPES